MDYPEKPRAGLLVGNVAIAAFLNLDPRVVEYLIQSSTIPFFRVGGLKVARRERLAPFLDRPRSPEPHPENWRAHAAWQRAESDTLEGTQAIADFLGAKHKDAGTFIDCGMPHEKGPKLTASRAEVLAWLDKVGGSING